MSTRNEASSPFSVVCFGEILWDVLPSGAKPGGAPMNVAYHLQKMGLAPAVITRIGADKLGDALVQLLQQNGTHTDFIQRDLEQPTGTVLATLNEKGEANYDIVQPVAWDFIAWQPGLQEVVANAPYFVYGSLATRNDTSRNTLFKLLEKAQTKVLDINLRPPHFTKAGIERLIEQCTILKINDAELRLVSNWYGSFKTSEEQMQALHKNFGVKTIVTTCGADGALLCLEGEVYKHPGFTVEVQDTVGSGDAFLAAFLYQLHKGAPPPETLRFANGLGAFVASCQGAWPAYNVEDVVLKMKLDAEPSAFASR